MDNQRKNSEEKREKSVAPAVITTIIATMIVIGIGLLILNASSTTSPAIQQQNPSATNLPATAPTQTNPLPVSQSQQTQPTPNENLMTESANGLNCKSIALEAAARQEQGPQGRLTTVLQSHYSQLFNQCYYEVFLSVPLSGPENGDTFTQIRVAPDDNWIAECSTGVYPPPQLFCTEHNVGLITQQEFQQLETYYLKQ